jgi:peptide/nickel transport system substrate-binding protein
MPRGRRELAIAVALLVALAAGAGGAGELRVGVPRLPASADPAALAAPSDLMLARLVYQGLVAAGERGEVEPALAAGWSVSRDGLTWTFRLRPDAVLHDGSPLTAAEVAAALARHLSPDEGRDAGPAASPGPAAAPLFRGPARLVRDVRAPDPGHVVFQLAEPHAPLLGALAHPAFAVAVPARDGSGRWHGTGPFRPVTREADRLVLEAVRPPRGAAPRVDRVVAVEIADDAAGLAELGPGGGLDLFVAQAPPGWGGLGLQVVTGPTSRVGWLALRTDRGPFSVRLVRQALSLALDPALLEPALGRWAVAHAALLPPGLGPPRGARARAFDPGRARRLLTEAGAVDSQVILDVPEPGPGPDLLRLADAVRLSLAAAGLAAEVRAGAPGLGAAARAAAAGVDGDLALLEVQPPLPDPHALLAPLLSIGAAPPAGTTNVARYRSPVAEGILVRASQLGFRPERLRLYERLDRLVAEDVPYLPLYARLTWLVARPGVRGLTVDPAGLHRLERAWVDEAQTR